MLGWCCKGLGLGVCGCLGGLWRGGRGREGEWLLFCFAGVVVCSDDVASIYMLFLSEAFTEALSVWSWGVRNIACLGLMGVSYHWVWVLRVRGWSVRAAENGGLRCGRDTVLLVGMYIS